MAGIPTNSEAHGQEECQGGSSNAGQAPPERGVPAVTFRSFAPATPGTCQPRLDIGLVTGPVVPCPLRARSAGQRWRSADTHRQPEMASDLQSLGWRRHDKPVPKLIVRVRFSSSAPATLLQVGAGTWVWPVIPPRRFVDVHAIKRAPAIGASTAER